MDSAANHSQVANATPQVADDPQNTVLSVRGLSKWFGAVKALEDVSFDLRPGEILGLVGDNGAGKTTLVRCLSGMHEPDEGEIFVDGKRRDLDSDGARSVGIETVHQNLSLIETLDVMQNLFLHRELVKGGWLGRGLGILDKTTMYSETQAIVDRLGLPVRPRQKVSSMSGGQRQMLAIARAVAWGRHIVMMDEPAAALGVRQAEVLLKFVRQLAESGTAVIFISHNMKHVLDITERVVVLLHGGKVADMYTSDLNHERIVGLITGSAQGTKVPLADL